LCRDFAAPKLFLLAVRQSKRKKAALPAPITPADPARHPIPHTYMNTRKFTPRGFGQLVNYRTNQYLRGCRQVTAIAILVASLGGFSRTAFAQGEPNGSLDLAFDAGKFSNGEVDGAALQSDGKLLVTGSFNKIHGVTRHGLARLNSDGTLDSSFDAGNAAPFGAKNPIVQPDGKIILAGVSDGLIARLNGDGSPDPGFRIQQMLSLDGLDDGSGNATNPGPANYAVLQPDGKIVIVGRFFFIVTGPGTSVARSCIARFNSNGTLDSSFNPGTGANNSSDPINTVVNYAVRQNVGANNGKIIIQGSFDSFAGTSVPGLVRLNPDGTYDGSFAPGTATFDSLVHGLFVQSDDQVIVFGDFDSFNGVNRNGIVRLGSSGAVDSGFASAAFTDYLDPPIIYAVAQQPDGKLMVGGAFHSLGGVAANNVVRLETAGARDAGFDAAAAGPLAPSVKTILVRPGDGDIFVGGYFSSYMGTARHNLAWANSDGSLDTRFNGLGGAADGFPQIYALAAQPDGKILVGGFFSSLNGVPHYNIVRLNSDSTIDPSFDPNLGTLGSVRSIFVQADGKILIGGNCRVVNGVVRGRVARLNSNGTLDLSFDPGAGVEANVYAVTADSSGSVYIGGAFQTFNGLSQRRLAKLTPAGALDPTFQLGTGTNGAVYSMIPPDAAGRIVIAGEFTLYQGTAHRIARLNATTGALDTAFTPGASAGFNQTVRSVALTPDGKYYAGGFFTSFNGQPRSKVARINADGTIDSTFAGPPPINQIVFQVSPQNGKVFAAGYFFTPPQNIERLTSTGSLDPAFDPGTGIGLTPDTYPGSSPQVAALAIQADGKLLIGGVFDNYNGTARFGLARLAVAPVGTPTPVPSVTPGITPTPTPTATPTPSPTPTATATATPTATPGTLGNISTRLRVLSGDNVLIGGMIATGTGGTRVILRAIGPSLTALGVPGALEDPTLELFQGSTLLMSNDDWQSSSQQAEIAASGFAPGNAAESAIIWTLTPGQGYTAIVRGKNGTTGVGVVEAYDLDHSQTSKLGNISTRGFVDVDNNVMIAGVIVGPGNGTSARILARALGPTLSDLGVPGALANTTLDLVNSSGTVVRSNDNWRDDPVQQSAIEAAGLAPGHDEEAALVETVTPGAYTAIVRGSNRTTGVALVEVYHLP
jgi:uncharacterized delta-60 repeat protein